MDDRELPPGVRGLGSVSKAIHINFGEVNIAKSDQVVLDGWVDCMLGGWLALILFCLLEVVLLMPGLAFSRL